ncbi:Gfo/Idh/MocA family protein [Fibrobacterota bacterium]
MLNVGIIGLGVGNQHIAGYESHPACRITRLCDFSPEKKTYAIENYPQYAFTDDANEVLTDPDIQVVSIASYDNYHAGQVRLALRHDKHVFIEKPLCLFEEEAVSIRELLRRKGSLRLSSNLILRKCPRFIKLKGLIDKGVLGRLFSVEGDYNYGRVHKITDGWRGRIDNYNVFYGGGVHLIDLLRWLTGDRIAEVFAYGNRMVTEKSAFRYNDFISAHLQFESGMIGKVSSNYGCVMPHFHMISIYGDKGTFFNDFDCGKLYFSRDQEEPYEKLDEEYPGYHKGDLIRSFIDAVLGNGKAEITADEVFCTMSVCFAVEKSIEEGRPVQVNYL